MDNNKVTLDTEEQNLQTMEKNDIPDMQQKGPIMQNSLIFLTSLEFACKAVIACVRQLNIMDEEHGRNYGTILAHSAKIIISAIKKDKILAVRPSVAFAQISQIIEKNVGDSIEGRTYSLFFDSIAKGFLRFRNDDQLTANMWLTVLTHANETLSENSERSLGSMLDTLICAEHKLRDTLDLDLNSIDAFGQVVNATETFASQTVHMPGLHSISSTNHKIYKYSDPGAYAVSVWMRAAYEGVKLKCDYKFEKCIRKK